MSSSVPGAVSNLIQIAAAALPADATVWFGKALPAYSSQTTLQILAVHTGEQEIATMGPDYRREERYEIQCSLTCWAGDNDHLSRFSEVYNAFSLLTVAIGNSPTLNGAVRFCEIRTFEYIPDGDGAGRSAGSLTFTIACQQRITSLT